MKKTTMSLLGIGGLAVAGAFAYARLKQPERLAGGGGGGGVVFNLEMIKDAMPETISSAMPTLLNIPVPDFSFIPDIIKSIPVPDVEIPTLPEIRIPSLPEVEVGEWIKGATDKLGDMIDTGKGKVGDLIDKGLETAKDLTEKAKEFVPVKKEEIEETFILSSEEIKKFRAGEEIRYTEELTTLYRKYGLFGALGKGFANLGALAKQFFGFLKDPALIELRPITTWGVPALEIKEPVVTTDGFVKKTVEKVLDVTAQSSLISDVTTPITTTISGAISGAIDMAKRQATILVSQGKMSLATYQSMYPTKTTTEAVKTATETVKDVAETVVYGGGTTTRTGTVGARKYTFRR